FARTPVPERGISVNQLRQLVQPPAEQFQHGRRVVLGRGTGIEKDGDAGAQSFYGTRVTRNKVVESRAGIWMAAYLVPMVATVRICAVIEKPFQSGRIHGFARGKDDGTMSGPRGGANGAEGQEKVHQPGAESNERGSHEGAVAPLVHIRSVRDHP